MLIAAFEIATDCHSKRGGERGARVTCAVAIVLTFGPQKKSVQTAKLPHRRKTIEPPGKKLVDVTLMTHVHHEPVTWSIEHAVERNR